MTISDGKIAGAVIAGVVILICCFLNGKKCRKRQPRHVEEIQPNESSLERHQPQDSLNGHIPLPGFGFGSRQVAVTQPVKFCTIYHGLKSTLLRINVSLIRSV